MIKRNKPRISRLKCQGHRGLAYIWAIIFLMLIILLVGLALDVAKVFYVGHQLQNAADAAALAGARIVKISQAQARLNAYNIALANVAGSQNVQLRLNNENAVDGDIVIGRYDLETSVFIVTTTAANALKVVARRTDDSLGGPVPLIFGPVANVDTSEIAHYAIAMASGGTGAGLIALAPDGTGLRINGTVDLNVNDGAIQVNSVDDDAVVIQGQPRINASELDITGDADPTGGFDFEPEFVVNTGVPPISDPLCPNPPTECMPPPSWDPLYDLSPETGETWSITGGTVELEPGYYSGGLRISGGDVTFKPGIYVLDGSSTGQKSGFVVGGNTNLCAKGVMFYITGDGVVDIAGTGDIRITPIAFDANDFCDSSYSFPDDTDYTYEGMSFFQDRLNTNDARIVGTGLMDLDGTLYFPENHVDLSGTGEGFGNQLIAYSVEISGTGEITINYDGRNRAPATRSFLVE